MPTFKQHVDLVRNMGFRYVKYRIGHILKTRTGFYLRKFPIAPEKKDYLTIELWKKSRPKYFISPYNQENAISDFWMQDDPPLPSCLDGKIRFFNAELVDIGNDYDWVTNPGNGYKYDPNKHWSLIEDYSTISGDIKFVWEKSRFSFIYDVIRYDQKTRQDHSEWIWREILSWIKANPVNAGPNYKCSQEISLRVFAWTSALYFYSDSRYLTESIFSEIQYALYWQLKHVYDHINFSRIAVRNNHAITESLALYVGGSVYSDFPEADSWKKKGKEWFEEEIAYQIYTDGTFLQFSMNYHRVVIQLMSLAISFASANQEVFNDTIYERAYSSIKFLYTCQDSESGYLPNYGSNDGALFFPLSGSSYRDYRPQLNALHVLLTGVDLYEKGIYSEEAYWWNARLLSVKKFPQIKLSIGWNIYPIGGYAILREKYGFSFIRCGNHKDRPAQADNLHLDIWIDGLNILHDSGSFKYNTTPDLVSWFMGTMGHNTVMLDSYDQMLKGPRFIWFNWSQCEKFEISESDEKYSFSGTIDAFKHLGKDIKHKRIITKDKQAGIWQVCDEIINKPSEMEMIQIWHPSSVNMKISALSNKRELDAVWQKGWVSEYYGIKRETTYLQFKTKENLISTTIQL